MATRQTRTLARVMMAPAVVVLLIWMIVPLAMTLWFSFQNYSPDQPDDDRLRRLGELPLRHRRSVLHPPR
jgi:ABC-type sugar transport system permease subunit